jgi:hypothetical protein
MFINLKRLKVPEIRKLAKTYNKLNLIPHPSTLKKSELITYLKEHLETNKKGHVNVDHPKLQKSIKSAIDRLKKEDEEAMKEFEETIEEIRADIKKNKPKQKQPEPSYRDTLTKEEREKEDRKLKHLIETGKFLFDDQPERKKTKKDIEHDERIKEAVKAIEKEREAEQEARSKRNQEIMKKVREEMKAKKQTKVKEEKPKKPTKKKVKEEVKEKEEEFIDEDETPEEKKMRLYFASIKDPKQRMEEVKKWMMSQRQNIKKKVEAREKPKLETARADELLKNLKKRNLQREKAQRILKEALDYLAEEKRSKKTQKELTDEQQNFIDNFQVLVDNGNKFQELEKLIDNKKEFKKLDEDEQEEIMDEYNELELEPKIEDFKLLDSQIEDYIKLYNYRIIGLSIVNFLFKNGVPDREIPFEKIKDYEQKYKKLIYMTKPEVSQLMFAGLLPYLKNSARLIPDNMKAEYKKAYKELENIYTLTGVV